MIIYILACIVSFIPFIVIYLMLRNGVHNEEEYKKLCDKTLLQGILCVFPVIFFSALTNILIRLTGLHNSNPLLYKALYTFIVLALVEEIVKFFTFRKVMRKIDYPYSWLDVTVLMAIVGIGFGMIESVVYSIGASVPVVLIRGICVPHASHGFTVGYFYGKGLKTGNPVTKWIGFVIAWLLHGLYDFSLSEEFIALNDNLAVVAITLAFLDIVLAIMLVVFSRKAKEKDMYTEPLVLKKTGAVAMQAEEAGEAAAQAEVSGAGEPQAEESGAGEPQAEESGEGKQQEAE